VSSAWVERVAAKPHALKRVGDNAPHLNSLDRLGGGVGVGFADGAADVGQGDVVAIVRLKLVGAGLRERHAGLQHVELGGAAGTIAGVGKTKGFLGLRDHLRGGLGEFGGFLEG